MKDFIKTFGPPPSELPANMANAMGVDQAIWGARIQGARWMAQQAAEIAMSYDDPQMADEILKLMEKSK